MPATSATPCRTPRILGFTGTPIESTDKSTKAVFGDYVDIYDLTRAVEDGATVRIFYESRLAKVSLPDDLRRAIDSEVDEITEGQELVEAEKAKSRWARIEAIVGAIGAPRHCRLGHRPALGETAGEPEGQGDDRWDVPAHLRRALRAHRPASAGVALRRPDARSRSRSS